MESVVDRFVRRLKAFLASLTTNLAKASLLFLIGFFGILDTLPHFIEAYEARRKFTEALCTPRPDGPAAAPAPFEPQEPTTGRG